MKKPVKRVLLLALIIAVIAAVHLAGFDRYLTFESIQENKLLLLRFVHGHYAISAAGYIVTYIIVTGFALPGAAIMTMTGGFLFGMINVVFVNIGATTGASLAFLFSRYLIGEWVQNKYGERLRKFNEEYSRNGRHYLLSMRLIPAIPFFLINVFSGMTTMPLRTFVWVTSLGIIPGSFVFTFTGTQLGSIRSPKDIVSTKVIAAFILLAFLSLLPVLVKRFKKARPAG